MATGYTLFIQMVQFYQTKIFQFSIAYYQE